MIDEAYLARCDAQTDHRQGIGNNAKYRQLEAHVEKNRAVILGNSVELPDDVRKLFPVHPAVQSEAIALWEDECGTAVLGVDGDGYKGRRGVGDNELLLMHHCRVGDHGL